MKKDNNPSSFSRRGFLQSTSAAMIGASLLPHLSHAGTNVGVSNVLKVGLIGCGGRGSGAAGQALQSDPNTVLTCMADIFPDRLDESHSALLELYPDRVKVDKEHMFIGFDAYQKVLATDVDVVLLTTPPGFRPDHFMAAVLAGKHAFCEKPVAVDAPGVRKVLEAARLAKQKKLSVMSGFCFRYD